MKLNSMTGNANNNNIETMISRLNSMSPVDKMQMFLDGSPKLLAKRAEYEVPENGTFKKVEVLFDIPNTQNQAHYFVEYDPLNPKDSRTFSIGVSRVGSDRFTSVQLAKGTKKEILEFITDKNNSELFKAALSDVSNSTDDYYSSF